MTCIFAYSGYLLPQATNFHSGTNAGIPRNNLISDHRNWGSTSPEATTKFVSASCLDVKPCLYEVLLFSCIRAQFRLPCLFFPWHCSVDLAVRMIDFSRWKGTPLIATGPDWRSDHWFLFFTSTVLFSIESSSPVSSCFSIKNTSFLLLPVGT